MKCKLIGIKHIKGSNANGDFAFDVAVLTSEMSDRDKKNGAKGIDVHTPAIPDPYLPILKEDNLGKEYEVNFYFANKRECIRYVAGI